MLASAPLGLLRLGAGTASVGIYANTQDGNGDDAPGALLASATGLNTGSTGDKDGTFGSPITLLPGVLYWVSLIGSAAATVRSLAIASRGTELGRVVGNTGVIAYLYVAGSGSTLPATAGAAPTAGSAVATPAIYLLEV